MTFECSFCDDDFDTRYERNKHEQYSCDEDPLSQIIETKQKGGEE